MLKQPRIEMHVDRSIPLLQHALPITLLQLPLQNLISAIRLLLESLVRIVVLRRVVMAEPVALPRHRTQRADEEEDPFVEVDFVLLAGARTELAGFVVHAQDVVDYGSGFPGHDACVGVFEGGDLSIVYF